MWREYERMSIATLGNRIAEKRRGGAGIVRYESWAGLAADGEADRSANRSADRRKNIGQHIVFPMSLSFRISAIVVIEAGRQDRPANRPEDRPDFRSFHLDRLKNKSLISHGIGQ